MKYEKGISVIVPVYNAEKFLAKCLDSIIYQTFKDIEILCMLDKNSSDSSGKILEKYARKDSRIKILRGTDGSGAGYNRNYAIEYATKEYIGFVDADDYIDDDYYERLYDGASMFDADVVMTEIDVVDEESGTVFLIRRYPFKIMTSLGDMFDTVLEGVAWDKIYRTEFLKRNNILFPEGVLHEDNFFLLKVLHRCNKLVTMPGSLYYWVRNTNSVCFNPAYSEKRIDDAYTVFNLVYEYMLNSDIDQQLYIKIIDFMLSHFAQLAFASEKYSLKLCEKALKIREIAKG